MEQEIGKSQANIIPIKVLFHSISDTMHCDDGFCSAWIAWRYYKEINCLDSVQFIPVRYGEPPSMDEIAGSNVFILDFSYPRKDMLAIKEKAKILTVLDHHKTAQKELEGIPGCIFDMNKSGAMLTWDFFYPHYNVCPILVQIVQDNDLWQHKIPHCQDLVRWIRSFPQRFSVWDDINRGLTIAPDQCLNEAKAITRYYQSQLSAQMGSVTPIEIGEHRGAIVNTGKQYASDICHEIQDRPIHDFGASYFIRPDGKAEVSLRSLKIDVSKIARTYGGGGHVAAAGFTLDAKALMVFIERGYI